MRQATGELGLHFDVEDVCAFPRRANVGYSNAIQSIVSRQRFDRTKLLLGRRSCIIYEISVLASGRLDSA